MTLQTTAITLWSVTFNNPSILSDILSVREGKKKKTGGIHVVLACYDMFSTSKILQEPPASAPPSARAHGRPHTQHLSQTTLSFSLTHSHMLTCKKARCGYMYGAIRPLVLILYGWLGNSRIEPSAWQSATAVQSSHKDTPQCVIPERSKELFIARVASGSHCTVLLTFRKPDEALFVSDPGLINPDADM